MNPIPAAKLERLVESLVDDYGTADRVASERKERLADIQSQLDERTTWALELDARLRERDQRLVSLTEEFDKRGAWALQLAERLAQRDHQLEVVRSSLLWGAARALRLAPRPREPEWQ